ncbi:MAG: hypothetical protein ACE5G2_11590 [Candidatus Krumholzibacteriia bacterium]
MARLGGASAAGISAVEFRVQGIPASWLSIPTANREASVALGDPFKGRCATAVEEATWGEIKSLHTN